MQITLGPETSDTGRLRPPDVTDLRKETTDRRGPVHGLSSERVL